MSSILSLRTGAWYGDSRIHLDIPPAWDVTLLEPRTPPPLSPGEIAAALEHPVGQPPLSDCFRGKSRPLIIVDDMNRPTPASEIMPLLVRYAAAAGIPPGNMTIVMATGTHRTPDREAFIRKVGPEAAACRLVIHDCFNDVERFGVTRRGTPVFANRALRQSDLVIGVSGIYPNHTAGFGGGSKLALGVLGLRSIYHLHFCQDAVSWGDGNTGSGFRRELDEIADMLGMRTNVSVILDGDRRIIRVYCGDQKRYFPDAVSFYLGTFATRDPGDSDIVISNTYPNDLSLTFARMKGFVPLKNCKEGASRIAIACCNEGLGRHNIWPFVDEPHLHKLKHMVRVLSVLKFAQIGRRVHRVLKRKLQKHPRASQAQTYPVWLYRTGHVPLPAKVPGMTIVSEWGDVLKGVSREQGGGKNLRVAVYPCAFLQVPG